MSTSLWHEGALFPIFEAETIAHSKLQMRDQVREGLRKVTRSVRLFQIYDTSLPATLEKADEIFDHLAEASNGQVVEHTWGLYPSQERNSLYDARCITTSPCGLQSCRTDSYIARFTTYLYERVPIGL